MTYVTPAHAEQAAEIAGLRVQPAMARRGILAEGMTARGSLTVRKVREVTAAEVLRQGGVLLSGAIADDVARVDEVDRVARQLATAAQIKGMISAAPPGTDRVGAVHTVWSEIRADADIGQGAIHIISLLGPEDALIALDRAISRDIWKWAVALKELENLHQANKDARPVQPNGGAGLFRGLSKVGR